MSDYGADPNPDLNVATDMVFDKALIPLPKVNVMQWTYANGISVQKYAHKKTSSNLLVKFDNSGS